MSVEIRFIKNPWPESEARIPCIVCGEMEPFEGAEYLALLWDKTLSLEEYPSWDDYEGYEHEFEGKLICRDCLEKGCEWIKSEMKYRANLNQGKAHSMLKEVELLGKLASSDIVFACDDWNEHINKYISRQANRI